MYPSECACGRMVVQAPESSFWFHYLCQYLVQNYFEPIRDPFQLFTQHKTFSLICQLSNTKSYSPYMSYMMYVPWKSRNLIFEDRCYWKGGRGIHTSEPFLNIDSNVDKLYNCFCCFCAIHNAFSKINTLDLLQ